LLNLVNKSLYLGDKNRLLLLYTESWCFPCLGCSIWSIDATCDDKKHLVCSLDKIVIKLAPITLLTYLLYCQIAVKVVLFHCHGNPIRKPVGFIVGVIKQ